jgi:4-hydroxybutyrate dehydrogenase
VEFKKKKTKLGLSTPSLYADQAVLIPSMLSTLPYSVFATSSIDALIHAVESHVSPKAGAFSRSFGAEAMRVILAGYQRLNGKRRTLSDDMSGYLQASAMAGIAFANAGVGAVHALSYPIGGRYHVPHGKANYMVFLAVFEEYRAKGADLSPLESALSSALNCSVFDVWRCLESLLDTVLECGKLSSLGADKGTCAEFASSVVREQQRLLVNNPVELSEEDIIRVYESCL